MKFCMFVWTFQEPSITIAFFSGMATNFLTLGMSGLLNLGSVHFWIYAISNKMFLRKVDPTFEGKPLSLVGGSAFIYTLE